MSGAQADELAILLVAAGLSGTLFAVVRQWPRLGAVLWLTILAFVPVWFSVMLLLPFPPAAAAALLVLAATWPWGVSRFTISDLLVCALLGLTVVPVVLGVGSLATAFVGAVHWGTGFVLGRVLPDKVPIRFIYRSAAVVFTVVAVVAVVEFLTQSNIFIQFARSNAEFHAWGELQPRGEVLRAEAAFGHSIALGTSLALAIPLTLASGFAVWVRTGMVMAMIAGSAVTLSRAGMAAAVLALVISLTLRTDGISARLRWTVAAGASAVGTAGLFVVSDAFASAGEGAQRSAGYRWDLVELLPRIGLLGESGSMARDASGRVYHGEFRSIDNALLLLGLRYGWLPLLLALLLILCACVAVVRRRASPGVVAVVAQLPALVSVALITQYATWFWFVAGLAVATSVRDERGGAAEISQDNVRQNDSSENGKVLANSDRGDADTPGWGKQ